MYSFPTALLLHVISWTSKSSYFNFSTITTFYPVYTHSPQQYSYMHVLSWTGKSSNTLTSLHLQHFTQCICIPHSNTHTCTFLNWQVFKHFNFSTITTFYTQCIYIPHSSTCTCTFLNWQVFIHFNFITLTTFHPMYMHFPQQYSYMYFPVLASFQTL